MKELNIVILGLSITSSWGNGHATTYRGLVRELAARNHTITFLERDVEWYADSRDLPEPPYCKTELYNSIEELKDKYFTLIRYADLVIVGSYVPDGVEAGKFVIGTAEGITAFYDIDTPVTLAKLKKGDYEYLHPDLISQYDMYLSFTGGPVLKMIEQKYGSPMARPLYCSFDPQLYFPESYNTLWDLGYLGTYSYDRQPTLQNFLFEVAEKNNNGNFVVAGAQYPSEITWPENVQHIHHLPPSQHREFYCSQRFALNVTRADMIDAGYSPSVRLFEAAACATPVISDYWKGIDSFFEPGKEILIATSTEDVIHFLNNISNDERKQIGNNARIKVLQHHTAAHRAAEVENYFSEASEIKNLKPHTLQRSAIR